MARACCGHRRTRARPRGLPPVTVRGAPFPSARRSPQRGITASPFAPRAPAPPCRAENQQQKMHRLPTAPPRAAGTTSTRIAAPEIPIPRPATGLGARSSRLGRTPRSRRRRVRPAFRPPSLHGGVAIAPSSRSRRSARSFYTGPLAPGASWSTPRRPWGQRRHAWRARSASGGSSPVLMSDGHGGVRGAAQVSARHGRTRTRTRNDRTWCWRCGARLPIGGREWIRRPKTSRSPATCSTSLDSRVRPPPRGRAPVAERVLPRAAARLRLRRATVTLSPARSSRPAG